MKFSVIEGALNPREKLRQIVENISACRHHKLRILAGVVLLVVELWLYFGTGVLLEDEIHFLGGEGLWDVELSENAPYLCQEFVPQYRDLKLVSFRMVLPNEIDWDGLVTVSVEDSVHQELFTETRNYEEITDSAFTDVEVNLKLKRKGTYYLRIACTPSSDGEYPMVSVCSKDYPLPENRSMSQNEELSGQQLVSRYHYVNAMTASRALNTIFLSVLTALGVIFGLPDNKRVRRAAGIVLLLAAPCVLGWRMELLNYNPAFYLPIAVWWNLGIMYALEGIVLLITHSTAVSIVLTNMVLTALYSANFFMLMYRGTSLRMNDFAAIGTAAQVVGDYDLTPNSHLAMIWGIMLLLAVFGVQTNVGRTERGRRRLADKDRTYWMKKLTGYAVTTVIGIAIFLCGSHLLLYTEFLNQVGFADNDLGWAYELIYSYDGYLVASCIEIKNSRILSPEGYTVERVEELLEASKDYEQDTVQENSPHVILILNESLADLRVLGNLEISEENLAFINSLKENTVKGYVNASVFGGGTANSEFEVLTGCSMGFFSVNYYPYQQTLKKPIGSMVSQMKENGYTTASIHPERAGNWNRDKVYKYYGFDRMLWKPDFEGAEEIHSGVSDAETYRRIIELYETREQGEKLFVFDLTMQNHGGYTMDEPPYAVRATNMDEREIDEYLSLIKISDEAFADLVGYFEKQDEKVVICMFGDHQPSVSDLIVDADLTEGNTASERMMNKYKMPFVIWANYDIEEADNYDISMNYLGGLLMRTAGIPMSSYFNFLEKQRGSYPIITINGYMDSEGNYMSWGGKGTEFPEYRMVQYNYLFDTDTVEWGF